MNHKPKVLIILNRLVVAGQANDTIPLAARLSAHFDVLFLYGKGRTGEEDAQEYIHQYATVKFRKLQYLKRSINPFMDVLAFFEILKIMLAYSPNVVHTHGAKSGALGRLAAFVTSRKKIIHTFHGHHFHGYYGKLISRLVITAEQFLAKLSTNIIAISANQYHDLAHKYQIASPKKITTIPIGLSEELLEESATNSHSINLRQQFNIPSAAICIGIIGRMVPIKQYHLFIEIAAQIITEKGFEHCYFLLVGDGELKTDLEHLKNTLNLQEEQKAKIIFTGWHNHRKQIYEALDMAVCTSKNEGTPFSLLEAQFMEKPVMAFDVGGVANAMIDCVTGVLIPPQDTATFVVELKKMIQNKSLRMEMGKQGATFVRNNFSKQTQLNAIVQLYLQQP